MLPPWLSSKIDTYFTLGYATKTFQRTQWCKEWNDNLFFIKKNIPLTVSYSNLISLFSKVSCPLRDCYHCVSEWVLEEKPISFFYDLTIYLWKYIASLKWLFIMNNAIFIPLIRFFCSTESCNYINAVILDLKRRCS